MDIISCQNIDYSLIHKVFTEGHRDYYIDLDFQEDIFTKLFFNIYKNSRDCSLMAFSGDKPVGLLIAGLRNYGGRRVLRGESLVVLKEYRNKGVGSQLLNQFFELAKKLDSSTISIDVLDINQDARRLYSRLGFKAAYNIDSYKLDHILNRPIDGFDLKRAYVGEILAMEDRFTDLHIPWHSQFDIIKKGFHHFIGYYRDRPVVFISTTKGGNIKLIYVDPSYRNRGFAAAGLTELMKLLRTDSLSMTISNNYSLLAFLTGLDFEKSPINSIEMLKVL